MKRNRLVAKDSRVGLRLTGDDRLIALVRGGSDAAFEALYERHSASLLSFCVYMLRSRQDAEDAFQSAFASAYRALRADSRPVALRPWLFTIARNECLSILRRRHPTVELNGELALGGDPARELEVHEELRQMLDGLRALPEFQRSALVLTEMHGLSQREVGAVLGVRSQQVKAYVYQARSNLIAERRAREHDCNEIREQLATARGPALLKRSLRRHLRSCSECRVYASGITRQRGQFAALLPIAPSLMLRYRTFELALDNGGADPAACAGGVAAGGSVAGGAVELAGGGVKALVIKMASGMAVLSTTAGVGASVIGAPILAFGQAPTSSPASQYPQVVLSASSGRSAALGWAQRGPARGTVLQVSDGAGEGAQDRMPATFPASGGASPAGGGSSSFEAAAADIAGAVREAGEDGNEQPAKGKAAAPRTALSAKQREEARLKAQEERRQDHEEDQTEHEEHRQRMAEERRLEHEERLQAQSAREASRLKRGEERQTAHEESKATSEVLHSERQQIREEHHAKGAARTSKIKEERLRRIPARERRRSEQAQRTAERE